MTHPGDNRILIVHHRRLDRWLLPGGHIEPGDREIQDTARREILEETGVVVADRAVRLISLDVHGIPSKGREPFHLHHDLVFAFQSIGEDVRLSSESRAVAWCGPGEFDRYALPDNVRRAYIRLGGRDVC